MHHTRWISRHPAGPEMEQEIKTIIDTLTRLSDIKIDKRQFVGWHGDIPIYARPWEDSVTLSDGTRIDVDKARSDMLAQLRWRALPVVTAAETITQHFKVKITDKQIRRWIDYDTKKGRPDGLRYVAGGRVVVQHVIERHLKAVRYRNKAA